MRGSLVALCCLCSALWAQSNAGAAPAEKLIFTNVNVVDVRDGEIFRNMTVVVEQGRIRAVAKVGLIAGGRGFHVVNAGGGYLIPGLWDMHVQTGEARAEGWGDRVFYPLFIANGVTGLRDMSADPELDHERQRIAEGTVVGPHLMAGADFVVGRKAARLPAASLDANDQAPPKTPANDPAITPRQSFLAASYGYQPIAPSHASQAAFSADTLSTGRTTEHLKGLFLACSSQEAELRRARELALARGDTDAYDAAELQAIASFDEKKARDLFVELSTLGTWQVPELVSAEAAANLDSPQIASDSHLRYVPVEVREQWEQSRSLNESSTQQMKNLKAEAAGDLRLVDSMRRAGMQFLTGTGGPDNYVFPGFSLHDELELMVKTGFSPLQALQAATFNPALFMAKLDDYGVVEKGRVADLVLLDGNPVEDIGNTRKIAAVVVGGKYYSQTDLRSMLAHVAALASVPGATTAQGQVPGSQ